MRRSLVVLGALLLPCLTPAHAGGAAPAPLPTVAPQAAGFSAQRLDALHRRIEAEVAAGQYAGCIVLIARDGTLMTANHLKHLADPHPSGAPGQGFGLGVRVLTDPGEGFTLGSPGTFGWEGAATTFVQIDPQERTVALMLLQHLPFNQDNVIATFTNGYYSALVDEPR